MKIGLVVDSSCDLPRSFFDQEGVELMPSTIRIGDKTFEDVRDERETISFHSLNQDRKDETFSDSQSYTSQQIEELFLGRLVCKYDHVFLLSVTESRSKIYENAMKASIGITSKYLRLRLNIGMTGLFSLAVINSRNIFTGPAVLAAEVIRLIKSEVSPSKIDARIREMVPHTYCYMVPPDLYHIYKRASKRGDKSISWMGYTLGSLLDIKPILRGHLDETGPVAKLRSFDAAVEIMFANVTRAIQAGLLTPNVCIGYGGNPRVVTEMPGYSRMKQAAEAAGTAVHLAPMSITGGVHTGPGCVTVAFVSDKHVFEEKV
jgi:DegV family protein with EDD domain